MGRPAGEDGQARAGGGAAEGASPAVEPEDGRAGAADRRLNPAEIRIDERPLTVGLLAKRLAADQIDLSPVLRPAPEPWSDEAQSRLVESMLVRIPIPGLYLDATDDERWLVVDGLGRLGAIRRFVVTKELALTGLEYLELDGAGWDALTRQQQRRIEETQVAAWLVQPGTPAAVRADVFRRIHGGSPVRSPQQARQALHPGPAVALLDALAASDAFVEATGGVRDGRMTAQECVLRVLAFSLVAPKRYGGEDLDGFLEAQLRALNGATDDERAGLAAAFEVAMRRARAALGEGAFRRAEGAPLNRALFEAWSVALAALDDGRAERLAERAPALREAALALAKDPALEGAVTGRTGDARAVRARFERVRALLDEVLA